VLIATACTTESKSNETQEQYPPLENYTENKSADLPAVSTYAQYAYAYLEQEKDKFDLQNPQTQLTFVSERIDNQNNKHIKLQQVHNKVPVWGHEIIVHIDENNQAYNVSGEILRGIQNLNFKPAMSSDRVTNMILQQEPWGSEEWKVNDSELCVFNHSGNNYLTYRLTMVKGLFREFLFVNANDGSIVHKISGTPTATRF
jgi:Zn-dependent metalloprotease